MSASTKFAGAWLRIRTRASASRCLRPSADSVRVPSTASALASARSRLALRPSSRALRTDSLKTRLAAERAALGGGEIGARARDRRQGDAQRRARRGALGLGVLGKQRQVALCVVAGADRLVERVLLGRHVDLGRRELAARGRVAALLQALGDLQEVAPFGDPRARVVDRGAGGRDRLGGGGGVEPRLVDVGRRAAQRDARLQEVVGRRGDRAGGRAEPLGLAVGQAERRGVVAAIEPRRRRPPSRRRTARRSCPARGRGGPAPARAGARPRRCRRGRGRGASASRRAARRPAGRRRSARPRRRAAGCRRAARARRSGRRSSGRRPAARPPAARRSAPCRAR